MRIGTSEESSFFFVTYNVYDVATEMENQALALEKSRGRCAHFLQSARATFPCPEIRRFPARLVFRNSFHFASNPFLNKWSYKTWLPHTNHTLLRDGDDCNKSQVVWACAPVAHAKSTPKCSYSLDCLED